MYAVALLPSQPDSMHCQSFSVSGLSLLGGSHWLSIRQSLSVSQSSITACELPKDSASTLIPVLQKRQNLEACMTNWAELAHGDG